jgi:hypothetical protein
VVLMGGSYKRCSGCGGRALSIATRCPGCGGEFAIPEKAGGPGSRTPRLSIPLSAPIVVLAGAGIVLASQVGRTASPPAQRSSLGAAVSAAIPSEVHDSAAAAAEPTPAPVLVAHRTIYLRSARSRSAPLEAVLEPGDTLSVDALIGGWYRVTFEGAVMGYAEVSGLPAGR